ncbi:STRICTOSIDINE SYNTHASE-LIKE 10-like protein [Drosera capensis]
MVSKLELLTAFVALLAILLTLYLPSLLRPPTLPGSKDVLGAAEIIQLPGAFGPESLVFDPNGDGPYTGVADGRVLKWDRDSRTWIEFAVTSQNREECIQPFAPELEHVCGRPLGLRFDRKTGDLYIADAYLGLRVVGPDGGLAIPVATEAEGEPFYFTNDVDIDQEENVIYLTDTSTRFRRREFGIAIFSGDKTGRLMKYEKSSKAITVLMRGLAFANGVALSKDRSFVLAAESTNCRILRYWLKGPKAGTTDIFVELPGYPDNVRRNEKGEFWVGLHAKKGRVASWFLSNPWAGKILLRAPLSFKQLHVLLAGGKPQATAIKLSEEGQVVDILEDIEGKSLRYISEVEERDGKLWIASVMTQFIGLYSLH